MHVIISNNTYNSLNTFTGPKCYQRSKVWKYGFVKLLLVLQENLNGKAGAYPGFLKRGGEEPSAARGEQQAKRATAGVWGPCTSENFVLNFALKQ